MRVIIMHVNVDEPEVVAMFEVDTGDSDSMLLISMQMAVTVRRRVCVEEKQTAYGVSGFGSD